MASNSPSFVLKLLRTCLRPACQTLSNAFLKSMEALKVLLYDDSTIEDLFYCIPAWSETCLFFCQQFLSLSLESVEDNSEHDLAGMADGTIVRPFLRLPDLLA